MLCIAVRCDLIALKRKRVSLAVPGIRNMLYSWCATSCIYTTLQAIASRWKGLAGSQLYRRERGGGGPIVDTYHEAVSYNIIFSIAVFQFTQANICVQFHQTTHVTMHLTHVQCGWEAWQHWPHFMRDGYMNTDMYTPWVFNVLYSPRVFSTKQTHISILLKSWLCPDNSNETDSHSLYAAAVKPELYYQIHDFSLPE